MKNLINIVTRCVVVAMSVTVIGAARPAGAATTSTVLRSTNWSGSVQVAPNSTNYTAVKATFTVPTVTTTPGYQYSSAWVGIGGFTSTDKNLVQTGIEADNANGSAQYWAWTDLPPAGAQRLPLAVHAGDVVTASVIEVGNNVWTMTVQDVTTGTSASRTAIVSPSPKHSAEAILERPTICKTVCSSVPLARTTNVVFDPVSYSTAAPGATPNWQPFFRTPARATVYSVSMVDDSRTTVLATPSSADADSDGFQVADGSAQPPPPST
ncbi:MAG: G1 family endopeptidase [Actinomycetota bacterium]|nr:G1 family endopeptidase [Actinomycetota bacterium]